MIPNNSYAIIIGAMKAGTTSLYNYLIQHPEICAAITKEPEYFSSTDIYDKNNAYNDLWEYKCKQHKIALEASPGYSKYPYVKDIPKKIFDYGINPYLIYIVRNPFDRILSHYHFTHSHPHMVTHKPTSEIALNLTRYYLQLSVYREYFPKHRILVIDFDNLTDNPQKTVNEVYDFLKLSKKNLDTIKIYNKTKNYSQVGLFLKTRINIISKIIPLDYMKKLLPYYYQVFSPKNRKLSIREKSLIRLELKEDLSKFSVEYDFIISKWGF